MIGAMLLTASSVPAERPAIFYKCDLGRVVGVDKDNKTIIAGSNKFEFMVVDGRVAKLYDPTPLLHDGAVTDPSKIVFKPKADGSIVFITPINGQWLTTLSIEATKKDAKNQVSTVTRLHVGADHNPDGAWDNSWFYFGYCTTARGAVGDKVPGVKL